MKLASIELIKEISPIIGADAIEVASVLGFKAVVKKGVYQVGQPICFIQPDTVLPDGKEWAAFYKAKSNRVKAIRLRNVWSEGIVEKIENVGYSGSIEVGKDIAAEIGVTKYDPPAPQDLSAKGPLPFGICKTDEERIEGLDNPPYGEIVDVTLKTDGQSCSFYWHIDEDGVLHEGVLGRTMEYKTECSNKYTQNQANLDALNKLSEFCRRHELRGLCVRRESHGSGIQKKGVNPHSALPLGWVMFSVWLTHERRYARKGDPLYFLTIAEELRLPTVKVLERDVVLTKELVEKYSVGMEKIDGQFFEGVVCQYKTGSCKILSKYYDSKK